MTDKKPDEQGSNVLPIGGTKKAAAKKTVKAKPAVKEKPAATLIPDEIPRAEPKPKRPPGRPKNPKLNELIEQALVEGSGWVILAAAASNSERVLWDAQVVIYQAAPLSREIEKMLLKNPRAKKAVEAALSRRGSVSTFAVLASTAVPILAGHGLIGLDAAKLAAPKVMSALGTPPAPKVAKAATPRSQATRPAAPVMVSSDDVAAGPPPAAEPSPQAKEVAARLAALDLDG